jgi:broad specificity phosphatase PhoE
VADKELVALIQRHGSTTLNEDNKFRARMDPPLDEQGLKQAKDAAENLRDTGVKLERIVSSPMLRTVQTADVFAEEFDLDVEQDRSLISWNLGFLSGKDRDAYQPILEMYVDNPKLTIPDGEPLEALEERTFEYFDKELKKEKLTIYVSHNSNIVTLESLIAGDKVGRPESSETSVQPGGTLAIYVNDSGEYSTDVIFGSEKKAVLSS